MRSHGPEAAVLRRRAPPARLRHHPRAAHRRPRRASRPRRRDGRGIDLRAAFLLVATVLPQGGRSPGRWRTRRRPRLEYRPPSVLAGAKRDPARPPGARGDEPEEFRAILEDAVRSRLRGVDPVGVYLSGGVDSGSVASVAGTLVGRGSGDVRAYTIVYDRFRDVDEREYAAAVVDRYG